jgi:hypothetical protein
MPSERTSSSIDPAMSSTRVELPPARIARQSRAITARAGGAQYPRRATRVGPPSALASAHRRQSQQRHGDRGD